MTVDYKAPSSAERKEHFGHRQFAPEQGRFAELHLSSSEEIMIVLDDYHHIHSAGIHNLMNTW